jgi:hypothetical protein
MKPNDFANALVKASGMLPTSAAAELRALSEVFAASKGATVAATLAKVQKAGTFAPVVGQPSVGDLLMAIAPLAKFSELYAKPAFAKDLQSVMEFLRGFSGSRLRPLVEDAVGILNWTAPPPPTPKEEVVERHLRRLQETLGNDPAFSAAYKGLDGDPDVGKLEIAAIAKRFTGKPAGSRSVALKKIWARHHVLRAFDAKSQSRDGRSAA